MNRRLLDPGRWARFALESEQGAHRSLVRLIGFLSSRLLSISKARCHECAQAAYLSGAGQLAAVLGKRPAADGMAQGGSDLTERDQDKPALRHAGRGQDDVGGIDDLVAAQEKIQIEGARTPTPGTLSQKHLLNFGQTLQQLECRSVDAAAHAGVEEQGLFGNPDRLGLEERGD